MARPGAHGRSGPDGKEQWWPRRLRKVKIGHEISKHLCIFPHRRTRIRTTISARVNPLTVQKVVLNKFDVSVETQRLVVDVPTSGIWANEKAGNP
ncbi:MAG: hypothetical protein NVS4B2_18000 [Chloroflexota bacterium]